MVSVSFMSYLPWIQSAAKFRSRAFFFLFRLVGFLTPQHSINASFLYGDLYTHMHIHCLGSGPSTSKVPCFEGAWGTRSGKLMIAPNACLTFIGTYAVTYAKITMTASRVRAQ
ncbi:uncharacterized protein B0J16DRAFT_341814 [Fusarium flagelliforme]|uniref:uncharacterized protein n=1 Tax=Fusarium flagelliforme TaxID=2675880 RepID=UPI001E8DD5B3|nr:uncharacterized protein B0J16DRAFT_341814 [Fusarium flagelliforme]KAH7185501.1 hypothetical protein B0J16DRAFT_341814 [Fusarium flagelliforme]